MTNELPYVIAEVTFIPAEDGGRTTLTFAGYRPHAVVEGTDEYLGVRFLEGANNQFGVPEEWRLELMYHPRVDYSKLTVGAAFSIREGRKIAATGRVLSRSDG
jgi:translation elongation factor EF-Tu-like GTPase